MDGGYKFSWVTRILCAAGAVLVAFTLPLFRYPRKYGDVIDAACERFSVDPPLVYAVIYTESGYRKDAVSAAGAVGLMQLMPATAEWCAKKIGVGYAKTDLTDPAYNIVLGTYYLSYLLKRFPDTALALAAYNAGEGNVRAWQAQGLTEIPFPETRAYVKNVLSAEEIYELIVAR